MTTVTEYRKVINERFGGVIKIGRHSPNGEACALEALSVAKGLLWTDSPTALNFPDFRKLNDAIWSSDKLRTDYLVPVIEAYWDWPTWTDKRKQQIITKLVISFVSQILPKFVKDEKIKEQCKQAKTLEESRIAAANAAAYAAAHAAAAAYAAANAADAADAANAAANAAAYAAAYAAANAADAAANAADAADKILMESCKLFIQATEI